MIEKLKKIFEFLSENRDFNLNLQRRAFAPVLCINESKNQKAIRLLYHVANTQSQPNMDNLASFYKEIYSESEHANSFEDFTEFLNGKRSLLFKDLYKGLAQKSGWGDKTAALFTKVIYQAHNSFGEGFHFWDDTPREIKRNDEIYLPVDSVIKHIFKEIGMKNPSFKKINCELKNSYSGNEIEVWDDLWFWGFITQKSKTGVRKIEFNENKYWSLVESEKDQDTASRIKEKSTEFIEIITRGN